jgi:DNA-binding LacI/PurR family transcriptional regulator
VLPLYGGDDDIQSIAMDTERAVVTLQLQTLLDAGHQRIAFASLDSAHRLTTASRQLLLPEVAASLGIEQPPHHVFPEDPEGAAAQVKALASAGYTAVCAVNDHVAGIVLAGARKAGIAVPDDVAVIGQGDQVLSAVTGPALTTVTIDPDRFAEALIEVVTGRINQLPAPDELPAPRVSLIRRDSV